MDDSGEPTSAQRLRERLPRQRNLLRSFTAWPCSSPVLGLLRLSVRPLPSGSDQFDNDDSNAWPAGCPGGQREGLSEAGDLFKPHSGAQDSTGDHVSSNWDTERETIRVGDPRGRRHLFKCKCRT